MTTSQMKRGSPLVLVREAPPNQNLKTSDDLLSLAKYKLDSLQSQISNKLDISYNYIREPTRFITNKDLETLVQYPHFPNDDDEKSEPVKYKSALLHKITTSNEPILFDTKQTGSPGNPGGAINSLSPPSNNINGAALPVSSYNIDQHLFIDHNSDLLPKSHAREISYNEAPRLNNRQGQVMGGNLYSIEENENAKRGGLNTVSTHRKNLSQPASLVSASNFQKIENPAVLSRNNNPFPEQDYYVAENIINNLALNEFCKVEPTLDKSSYREYPNHPDPFILNSKFPNSRSQEEGNRNPERKEITKKTGNSGEEAGLHLSHILNKGNSVLPSPQSKNSGKVRESHQPLREMSDTLDNYISPGFHASPKRQIMTPMQQQKSKYVSPITSEQQIMERKMQSAGGGNSNINYESQLNKSLRDSGYISGYSSTGNKKQQERLVRSEQKKKIFDLHFPTAWKDMNNLDIDVLDKMNTNRLNTSTARDTMIETKKRANRPNSGYLNNSNDQSSFILNRSVLSYDAKPYQSVVRTNRGGENADHSYFTSKKQPNEVVYVNRQLFSKIELDEYCKWEKNLLLVKKSFIETSGFLFENHEVKVAMKSNMSLGDEAKPDGLCITLFYCNKTQVALNNCHIKMDFARNLNRIKAYPNVFSFVLKANTNLKQDFLIEEFHPDDEVVMLTLEYSFTGSISSTFVKFPLPMTVNKFWEFMPLDKQTFKSKWKYLYATSMSSNSLRLNKDLIATHSDFQQKFYPFLVMLSNPLIRNQSPSVKKYGGAFVLNQRDYLLKLIIFDDKAIIFELCDYDDNKQMKKAIIDTLAFFFTK